MILSLICGLCSVPNMLYFSGNDYSLGQEGVQSLLAASAICTYTSWVPCPKCELETALFDDRVGYATSPLTGKNITFAVRNNCEGTTLQTGFLSYGILWLVLFFFS